MHRAPSDGGRARADDDEDRALAEVYPERPRGVRLLGQEGLDAHGVTREQVAAFLDANPKFRSPFHEAKHICCGNNAGSRSCLRRCPYPS